MKFLKSTIPYSKENAEFWDYKDENEKFGSKTNHVSFWIEPTSGMVLVGSFLPRFPDPISTIDQVTAHFPNLKFTLTTEEIRGSDFIDRRDSYLSNDGRVSVGMDLDRKSVIILSFLAPRNRSLGSEAGAPLKK